MLFRSLTMVTSADAQRRTGGARDVTPHSPTTQEAVQASAPASDRVRHVVVVDGLEDLLATLGALHRGDGLDLFLSALRDGPSHGTVFALSGGVLPSSSLAALVRHRLILSRGDKHDDAFLGVPAPLAGLGGLPGRGVLVTGDEPLQCQVARVDLSTPGPDQPGALGTEPASGAGAGRAGAADRAGSRFRIEAVPFPVRTTTTPAPGPGLVLLGQGGDDAGPVWVAASRTVLVCGPHGSGRTGTLDQLISAPFGVPVSAGSAARRAGLGDTVLGVVSRDPRLAHRMRTDGTVPTLSRLAPGPAARFVEEVTERLAALGRFPSTMPLRLVVDDLDTFMLACPAATEALWALVEDYARDHDGTAGGEAPQITLLASATTMAAAGAFRGVLADLRAARYGVVLSPGVPGSSEVFGTDLGWQVEPAVRWPGRGVLVDGSSSTFVQVAHVS